jgi:hypothetical protein
MPLTLRQGRVSAIGERHAGLVRLEVDGRPCVAYPRLTGPVALGDDVLVNSQALDLDLGSGGFDVLHANLTRGVGLPVDRGAHVMKLPYTSLQHAATHGEEDSLDAGTLEGMPVVACALHSHIAPVCAGVGQGFRLAYLQLAGGALPVSLSDTIRALRRTGFIDTAIAVGACLDGDVACVTAASALSWVAVHGFDAAICSIGPGIVGTASRFGHGAAAAAEAMNAAAALGGDAILVPRLSSADTRERHRGLSHHTSAVLELCLGKVTVAWPAGFPDVEPPTGAEAVDVAGWEDACAGLPLSSMGRGPGDDPWFFAAAFAAGRLARSRVARREA